MKPLDVEDELMRLVEQQLSLLGEDADARGPRSGRPTRVAKRAAVPDVAATGRTCRELVNEAIFEESNQEMILVRDIEVYSLCEHHLLPFFGKAHVAYIPDGQHHRALEDPPDRRRVRAEAPGAGAPHRADRRGARRRPQAQGRGRHHRGAPPLHDDARRREAEFLRDHQRHDRYLQDGSEDAIRVPRAGRGGRCYRSPGQPMEHVNITTDILSLEEARRRLPALRPHVLALMEIATELVDVNNTLQDLSERQGDHESDKRPASWRARESSRRGTSGSSRPSTTSGR